LRGEGSEGRTRPKGEFVNRGGRRAKKSCKQTKFPTLVHLGSEAGGKKKGKSKTYGGIGGRGRGDPQQSNGSIFNSRGV